MNPIEFIKHHCYLFTILCVFLLVPLSLYSGNNNNISSTKVTDGFTENRGQIIDQNNNPNPGVLYLLNTPGMNVQLRKGGFSYDLYRITNNEQQSSNFKDSSGFQHPASLPVRQTCNIRYHRIDLDLVGSNPDCKVITSGLSTGYKNYYTTGTPVEGVTAVRSYQTVTCQDIYPGIDLEFIAGRERTFEYNFIVHPGADPSVIRIRISGPEKIRSFSDGILYRTSIGKVEETIPLCYYKLEGISVPVEGQFRKLAEHFYGFVIEQPVPEGATLVIDPIPTRRWGTYYGTSSCTYGGSSIDNTGNVYIAGHTTDPVNIATAGAFQSTKSLYTDIFLTKFSPSGQRIWGTYYGGTESDNGTFCTIDHAGNIYVAGASCSPGLATPGAWQTTIFGIADALLVKFDSAGIRLWATYYGGDESLTEINDIFTYSVFDSLDNVYCTGTTSSSTNIASPGAHQTIFGGINDSFIVKFTSSGNRVWATYYGGAGEEQTPYCTLSKNGLLFLSGTTFSSNNISTPGSFLPVFSGLKKAFLVCFDLDGVRQWGTYFGGLSGSVDLSYGCCADSTNGIYLVGETLSPDNIGTPGTYQPSSTIGGGFLEKFDISGQRIWGTYYGYSTVLNAITSDSDYVYICGQTLSYFQDPLIASPNAYQTVEAGSSDAFLAKFDMNGQRIWGTYYGGPDSDRAFSMCHDSSNNVYLYGLTMSTNNSSMAGLCTRDSRHNIIASQNGLYSDYFPPHSAFLIKFSECYSPDTAAQIYGPLSLCRNSTGVVFSIDPLISATSYQWCVSGNLTITSGQGTTSITVDVGHGIGWDTISVYGINACDNGFPKIITRRVSPRPIPVISGTDTTCTGAATLYSTAGGKSMYQWMVSPGGAVASGGGTGDSTCTVTWSSGGAQWIRVNYTDTTGCQADSPAQFNVWVIAGPVVGITVTPSANTVCAGTSVTFTATPVNEGTSPVYQWKVNGSDAGTNNQVYTYTPANGDVVQCILTSNVPCASGNPAASNTVTMVVNPVLPVSVSITTASNPVCEGIPVTVSATPVNGGSTPAFQWKVNGLNVGTNSPNYSFVPFNDDIVSCVLTSDETCPAGNPATSNSITMTVNPNLAVSVTISPSSNPFCPGSPITFTATPVNEGLTPQYQWMVNGINTGINSPNYTYTPGNDDQVTCVLSSSIPCPLSNPVTSNMVTMIQNTTFPAGITIAASQNPFCPGSSVTCTATPGNGGTNPVYQWKVNGLNVGINSSTYTFNPVHNDSVRCIMTSNLACVSGNPASSDKIVLSGTLAPVVTFTSCFDTITTLNAKPIRLKGGIPLNGTYSGPGVNSATGVFIPSAAGTGTKTITYTYTNAALCSASKARIVIVQTTPAFTCGNNLKDIRDNQVYPTVPIGSQCWMASNLNYGSLIPGTTHQRDNCINEKFCYNNLPVNCGIQTYYQWDELMRYDDTPAQQGLCPPGWHVPTEADWNALFANWTNNGFAGSPLKYSGFSGFDAILSGARHHSVQWDYAGFAVFCWSSTSHGPFKAWAHGMNEADPSLSRYPSLRSNAFSVRCLKD